MDEIEKYKPYIDKYGLVQDEPNGTSQNAIRYTAEAIFGGYPQPGALQFAILGCEERPGILSRHPGNTDQQGPDDYIAALAVSWKMELWGLEGGTLAQRIYQHGKDHFGFFCNDKLQLNAFLWRNPSLFYFTKFCATGSLSLLGQIVIASSLKIAAQSTKQDSKVLSWFMVRCLKGKYPRVDTAISLWQTKLKEQATRGIGEILGAYYSPMHFDHPNSQALIGVFE